MRIEIGEYYINEDGELVYVFGQGGFDVTRSISYPSDKGIREEDVTNMIAIKVAPFIIGKKRWDFYNSICITSVYRNTGDLTDPDMWTEANVNKNIKERFEKTGKFMKLIKMFIDHMVEICKNKDEEEKILGDIFN